MSGLAAGVRIYGIRQCDTMKRAFAWLDEHDIDYTFHDYKKHGIDRERVDLWCGKVGWEKLVNRRGTTWRRVPEEMRDHIDVERAIYLMVEHPTLIKRPVLEAGDELIVGFDAERYHRSLCTA